MGGISPEFFNWLVEEATANRDQKKKELRDYSQDALWPKDSTGRRLTYQEQQNSGGGDSGKGRYYQENQTLGSLAGEQGKAYIQGVEEKKKALDDAQKELGQIVYAADMDEILRMSQEEQDALASYKLARDLATMDGNNPVHGKTLYQEWNRVQEIFRGRYDGKRINELTETYGRYQNAEMMRKAREYGQAQGHGDTGTKIWSSALTIPANVLGKATSLPGHMLDMTYSTGRYGGFDPNSMGGALGVYADSVRGAVAEDIQGDGENVWRNAGAWVYQNGMEGLDSLASGVLYGNLDPLVSAADTFGDTLSEASARGASYDDAMALAAANSVVELITEAEPLDKLADKMLVNHGRGRDIVKRTLAQMGIELTGQEFELVAGQLADVAIMQENSRYSTQIAGEMLQGKSFEEARTAASRAFLKKVQSEALSSLAFGFVDGLGKGTADYRNFQRKEKERQSMDGKAKAPEILPDGRKAEDVNRVVDAYTQFLKEQEADAKVEKLRYGKEFEELKESLGENAPKTLEDFRDLKYSSGDWEQFQSYRKAIESGKLSAMADFDLYKKTSGDIDKMLVGVTTSNGIQIKSKSDYFIARVIGSVEERQSGVDLNDVLSVLTDPNTKVFAEKIASNGTVSQKFKLGNIEVTVNPKTGKLIRVRP